MPIKLRLLRGNPGRRPVPRQAAEPSPGAECPTWLPREAKAEWARLAPELERLGLLTVIDRACFVGFCEAWAEFKETTEEIERTGMITTAANGTLIPNPLVGIRNGAMKQLRAFASEFGCTPASRAGLAIPGPGDDDPEGSKWFFGPRPVGNGPKEGA